MVLPSKRFRIWERLYTRFMLEPPPAGSSPQPAVVKTIQPVTNVDELLTDLGIDLTTGIVGTATGGKEMRSITEDEEWECWVVEMARQTGDRTIDTFSIKDPENTEVVIEAFTATATYRSGLLVWPLKMRRGWKFMANFSGAGTTDGTWKISIYRAKQDLY